MYQVIFHYDPLIVLISDNIRVYSFLCFALSEIKNKGYLLGFIVPWRNFNIHGTFPFDKKFFKVQKSSLDY